MSYPVIPLIASTLRDSEFEGGNIVDASAVVLHKFALVVVSDIDGAGDDRNHQVEDEILR